MLHGTLRILGKMCYVLWFRMLYSIDDEHVRVTTPQPSYAVIIDFLNQASLSLIVVPITVWLMINKTSCVYHLGVLSVF